MHDLAASGIQLAAISLGADGIIASDGGQTWYGKLHMPRVTNIVGCGDSALAGMALAINSGLGLPEMLRWGVACGAANTQTPGAGFIQKEAVKELLPLVALQRF